MHQTEVIGIASKALAELLREYGRYAFATEETPLPDETRAVFDGWARHVLTGEPAPGNGERTPTSRDFRRLLSHFSRHREQELSYVKVGLRDVRALVWTFAAMLAKELSAEEAADEQLETQVSLLKRAAEGASNVELRREADATLDLLRAATAARRKRRKETLGRLSGTVRTLRSELQSARKQLALDPLTQLYNRAALDEHIARIADIAALSGIRATVLMIDLDHFKRLNDSHGHAAGDVALKSFARLLQHEFPRRSELVARYGGEEFCVVLQEEDQGAVAERVEILMAKLHETSFSCDAGEFKVTVSIGAATIGPGEGVTQWLRRADEALYAAKRAGRDQMVVSKG